MPGDDVSVRIESALEAMHIDGAVETTTNVVFARPDELDWHATINGKHRVGEFSCKLTVLLRTAPEASTREENIELDLL